MTTLVAYASTYGATRQIAERITSTLVASGVEAECRAIGTIKDVAGYDAFVIGSAVYFGSWLKEAVTFTERFRAALVSRPLWLFSSGPVGSQTRNAQGQDVREAAEPTYVAELVDSLAPRGHRVFFGALDHTRFGLRDRMIYAFPASRKLFIDGDFLDWSDVEAWAKDIAGALTRASV